MDKLFLLPHWCRKIGMVVFPISLVLEIACLLEIGTNLFQFEISLNDIREWLGLSALVCGDSLENMGHFTPCNDLLPTAVDILFIVGSCLLGFSKLRDEDEYFSKIRMQALVLAVYMYAAVLIIGEILCWSTAFLYFMRCCIFAPVLFFLIFFYARVAAVRKGAKDEK
ncbi:MAG: hypothetical protein MJZ77_03610 [Bacteroidales bacterium]|nr:hypothetical protein [Bacteroidales bacterium]